MRLRFDVFEALKPLRTWALDLQIEGSLGDIPNIPCRAGVSELTKGLHAKLGGLLQKAEEPGNKKTCGGQFPAYR